MLMVGGCTPDVASIVVDGESAGRFGSPIVGQTTVESANRVEDRRLVPTRSVVEPVIELIGAANRRYLRRLPKAGASQYFVANLVTRKDNRRRPVLNDKRCRCPVAREVVLSSL